MTATPDEELTKTGILRRASFEQERADLLKRRGFLDAAILRGKEVTELREIARLENNPERKNRFQILYRQRDIDKRRDPLFASSYAVKGWKAHRTFQENRFLKAKSDAEKADAEAQLLKYSLVVERAEGNLPFNPMIGDELSLEAELLVYPVQGGLVYLAHCDNWGPYMKIGCTADWNQRQKALQTGAPENVRLWAFAKLPTETDLKLYEEKFHLVLGNVQHPLGREFFQIEVESFEALARKLNSPLIRSRSPGVDSDVSLVEELKDTDL